MHIHKQEHDLFCMIVVVGKVNTTTSDELKRHLFESMPMKKHLVIEGTNMEYLASTGIRSFIEAEKELEKSGKELLFYNLAEEILEILLRTGHHKRIKHFLSLDDVITYLESKESED